MSQPQWGIKRRCASCSAPFYDLHRNPIRCPKCDTIFVVGPVAGSRSPSAGRMSRARAQRAPYTSSSTLDSARVDPVPDDSPRAANDASEENTTADEPEDFDAGDDVVELDEDGDDEVAPTR